MTLTRSVALLLIVLAAAGCRGSFKPDVVKEDIYVLSASAPATEAAGPLIAKAVVVEPPAPAPGLDSEKIALHRGHQLDYYAAARWADRVPVLLQALLAESLENTGRLKSVSNDTASVAADYALTLEVRDFQAVYGEAAAPAVQVRWTVKLLSLPGRAVLASIPVQTEAAAAENRMGPIVEAFNAAARQAVAQTFDALFPVLERDSAAPPR